MSLILLRKRWGSGRCCFMWMPVGTLIKPLGTLRSLSMASDWTSTPTLVNWDAVKRMQSRFPCSGIPDQDLVQDAAFFSGMYKFAREYKIKHIITGSNFSTECCREPEEWGGYLGIDKTLLVISGSGVATASLTMTSLWSISLFTSCGTKGAGPECTTLSTVPLC